MDKNKVLFTVQSIEGVKFPEEGDSIWINAAENVMDASANAQLVINNKKVRLIIVLPPFVLEPYVIGPRDPQDKAIPVELKKSNGLIINGTIILLKPNIFVPVRELMKVRVAIEIYDPLGNSIANGKGYEVNNGLVEMHARQIGQDCYIIILWADGNTRNRIVGSGSYLGMLSIEYPDGSSESKKVMIPMKQ
jgi:hypothetical protein